jgi:hypothetical protein
LRGERENDRISALFHHHYDTAADCETARQQLVLENTDNPSIPIDYNALGEQAKALVSLETSAGIWDIDF